MNNEKKIIDKFGRSGGMKAPEGFLEDVCMQVRKQRVAMPKPVDAPPRSFWHKIRPYVYMAAMFAGIWCMMKVFTISQSIQSSPQQLAELETPVSFDNPPKMIAEAVVTPEVAKEISLSQDIQASATTEYELEQAVAQQYEGDFERFEEAFDYEFETDYADLNVEEMIAQMPHDQGPTPKE